MRLFPKVFLVSLFGFLASGFALVVEEARAGKITGGENQSCAVSSSGAVTCWGQQSSGSLGDGKIKGVSFTPVQVTGLTSGATDVAGTQTGNGGSQYACAIVSGGLKCWGTGGYGTLGDGSKKTSLVPVQVQGLTSGVTAVSLNATHACAIQSGAAKCWGSGVLGAGKETKTSPVPVQATGLTSGVTGIAVGWRHACALAGGAVSCWGYNHVGQLGSKAGSAYLASPVAGLSGPATAIAAGTDFSCAIVGGGVQCWGSGSKIGSGSDKSSVVPLPVQGLGSGVTAIAANSNHACAIKGGTVWCWGYNNAGQLGNGATLVPGVGAPVALTPAQVVGLSGVTSIGVGRSHSCAIAGGGVRWCWGSNGGGQLGTEAVSRHTSTPVKVTGAAGATVVAVQGARLNSARTATIAKISCPAGATCLVSAPKVVTVRVGGKAQLLKLTVPRAIGAGKSGGISVTATAAGAAALKGKTVTVTTTLMVSRNGTATPLKVTAKVSG